MIRNICLILVIAAMSAISSPSLHAQGKIDREQWMNEIQQYKRGYFAKELGLTKEQQDKFFPLYEEMEQQTHRIEEESRIMEKRVSEAEDATALEYEKATEALYDAKVKDGGHRRRLTWSANIWSNSRKSLIPSSFSSLKPLNANSPGR